MLKRVSIQNFKSLKDVTLDLQKVNLLIGPNNSGKTNFLKALELMASISNKREKTLFDLPNEIHFNRVETDFRESISIDLTFDAIGGNRFDYFRLSDADETYFVLHSNENGQPNYTTSEDSQYWLLVHIGELLIYKPDPNSIINSGVVGNNEDIVNSDASNLVGFLDLMLGKYRRHVFSRIERDLRTCLPEFDEINLEDAQPSEEQKKVFGDKSFKRIGLTNSRQNTIYWANELSEGTLYFIALLCIINQPNPPKLLLLEEPEKGIHPRRIFEVIQFIFRLAEEKDVQVIMTTHSPIVVDMFKDMPESVFIFDKDDEGATHVKNLQRDIIEPETEKSKELGIEPYHYTDSLGDAWTVGFLGGVPK
jgi:predicted ATPase